MLREVSGSGPVNPDTKPFAVRLSTARSSMRNLSAGPGCSVAASGDAWTESVNIKAVDLREFEKRFKDEAVVVGVWEGHLEIGRINYPLLVPSR